MAPEHQMVSRPRSSTCQVATLAKPQGASCSAHSECQTGLAWAGVACTPSSDACSPWKGLYCDGATSKCKAAAWVTGGQPCGLIAGTMTYCYGGQCSTYGAPDPGQCGTTLKLGEACTAGGTWCRLGLECASGVCSLPASAQCP